MAYLKKISAIGKVFYPSLLWKMPSSAKTLYLTFDDGPIPKITPWVLQTLKKFDAKGTFFCVGDNIQKHPEIYWQLLEDGHRTANHTFNHIKGWETSTDSYLQNVFLAEEALKKANQEFDLTKTSERNPDKTEHQKLFRPPYGRITPVQIKKLQKLEYKIVMWDVISGDFDAELSAEDCYQNVIKNCGPGSIVVFHDSLKASEKLKIVLPRVLQYYRERDFIFEAI